MASGERVTLTFSRRLPSSPLRVDVYPFTPKIQVEDGTSLFAKRLPFVLFLHGGSFLAGSRHDIPPWLVHLCRDKGFPLLSADYGLAPHTSPRRALEDIRKLWELIRDDEINWAIMAAGSGAEVETGTKPLEDEWPMLQRYGGIDSRKAIVVGIDAGGTLAALGGATLSPAPLALVLGYPISNFVPTSFPLPSPGHIRPSHISDLLSSSSLADPHRATSAAPLTPWVLDNVQYTRRSWVDAGMDERYPWKGEDESKRREGIIDSCFQRGDYLEVISSDGLQLPDPTVILSSQGPSPSSTTTSDLAPLHRSNFPYPPTLIYHGEADEVTPLSSSVDFLAALRRSEPGAAALDDLMSKGGSSESNERLDPTRRYALLSLPSVGNKFDALLPRNGSTTYSRGLGQMEAWLDYWKEHAARDVEEADEERRSGAASALDGSGKGLLRAKGTRAEKL